MWQHMFSMRVMRTVWRRELESSCVCHVWSTGDIEFCYVVDLPCTVLLITLINRAKQR